ncbi:MAG: hypothetical protein AABX05_02240, partial [Nanoarchaeota archaeon]
IYSALELVVDSIINQVHLHGKYYSLEKQFHGPALKQLQEQGYDPKMSFAFFKACYWHMVDNKQLKVESGHLAMEYSLLQNISGSQKIDICLNIFSEYESFLQANYQRSSIEPDPYLPSAPVKGDFSPTARQLSAGK